MDEVSLTGLECIARIQEILLTARHRALQSVNAAMIAAYWEIGREIVEEQQRGAARAEYGAQLLKQISERLTTSVGKGFSVVNLRLIRQFYFTYRERPPEIRYAVSSELPTPTSRPLSDALSWTHYRILMRVSSEVRRDFYEAECATLGSGAASPSAHSIQAGSSIAAEVHSDGALRGLQREGVPPGMEAT